MQGNLLNVDWGDAFKGFFPDPQRNAQIALTAEQIKASQLKRAMEEDILRGKRGLIGRQNAQYDAMLPPPTDVPMPPDIALPPFDASGNPMGQATVTPAAPLQLPNLPRDWGLDEPFYRNRETDRSRANLAVNLATTPEGLIKSGTAQDALSQLQLYGVPQGKPMQDIMQTQLSGLDFKMPGYGTQPTVHNYVDTNPTTGERATGRTLNGVTDLATGRPLSPNAQMAGAADAGDPNIFKTPGDARAALDSHPLVRKALSNQELTVPEVNRLMAIVDTAYPESLVQSQEGGRNVTYRQRTDPISAGHQPLIDIINAYRAHQAEEAAKLDPFANPAARAVPYTGQEVPTAGAVDPSAVAPIVPPQMQAITNNRVEVGRGPVASLNLADNYRAEPIYKKYHESLSEFGGLANYAQGGRNGYYTNGGDLAIIYTVARIMDDRTGVRDAELNMYQRLGTVGETAAAILERYLRGGGILPPEVRADIVYSAQQKLDAVKRQHDALEQTYSERAQRGGVDPNDILPRLPQMPQIDYDQMVERGKKSMLRQNSTPPPPNNPREIDPNPVPPWLRR